MANYKIVEAKHIGGTKFYVRFDDGLEGELDYKDFNTKGLGADLLNPSKLSKIFIEER